MHYSYIGRRGRMLKHAFEVRIPFFIGGDVWMNRSIQSIIISCLITSILACAGKQERPPSPELVEEINTQRAQAAKLIDESKYSEALEILTTINDRFPEDASILGMLAWAQWKTGSASEAVENFEASLRRNYTDYITHLRFANMLMEMGRIGRALTEFELATTYNKNDPMPYYNYGLALYKRNRKQEALVEWQQAYDLDRNNPRFAEAMGIGLTGVDDREALLYFEKAESLSMKSASFHHNYALLLQRLGEYERAELEFESAIKEAPDNTAYSFGLAALHMNSGEYEKALPIWKRLVERSPQDMSNRIYLARANLELGRFAEAISALTMFEEAARSSEPEPKNGNIERLEPALVGDAFGILAMSYRGEKNLKQANFFIEKALGLNPRCVEHLINYGVILAERGNIGQAKIQWQKVLELEPGNETARQNLSAFER